MKTKLPYLFTLLLLAICFFSYAQPNLQWQKNFGGGGTDSAFSIKQTTDGGYIVVGQSYSTNGDVTGNHGGSDYWVAKLDASGNITWQKSFGGSGSDIAKSVIQTFDGGYMIAGISNSKDGDVVGHGESYITSKEGNQYLGDIFYEPWILALDNNGTKIGAFCIHRTLNDNPYVLFFENSVNTIIQTSDSNFIVAGQTPLTDGSNLNTQLISKFSRTGEDIWTKTGLLPGGSFDIFSIVEASSGYVFAGTGESFGSHGGLDMLVMKIDLAGNYVWGREIGGTNDDKAFTVQSNPDGSFIVAGVAGSADGDWSGSGNHGGDDYALLKLDANGNTLWSKCFGGSASDIARSVQQAADGSYLVAGSSASTDGQVTGHTSGSSGQTDYWVTLVDANGNFVSGKCYGGSSNDDAWSIEKTTGASFVIAGSSASTDAGFVNKGATDYWLIKLGGCSNIPLPVAANQALCNSANPTVANLKATGTNLKWYGAASGGTALSAATQLHSGLYYVSQTTAEGCESGRKSISVTVNPSPLVPHTPGVQLFSRYRSPKVSDLLASGTNIKWYKSASGGVPLPLSTRLQTGYYYASQTSVLGCESGRKRVSVVVLFWPFFSNTPSFNDAGDEENRVSANVYPNPSSNGKVTVNIKTSNSKDNATIQLLDLNGRTLMQTNAVNNKGSIQKILDVSKLPSSIYIIRFTTGKQSGNIKLVLTK